MLFTVYRITNLINNKTYIGKHQTKNLDDGYMGSGKLLRRAIKKYGVNNFKKDILHVFDTEAEMNDREKEIVVLGEMSYNLCPGGQGGFGYINQQPNQSWRTHLGHKMKKNLDQGRGPKSLETRQKIGEKTKGNKSWLGLRHSDETKEKMRRSHNPRSNPVGVKRGPYKKVMSG